MFPIWAYVAVALTIALVGFAAAQLVPGLGAMLVASATTLWAAYAAHRAGRRRRRRPASPAPLDPAERHP